MAEITIYACHCWIDKSGEGFQSKINQIDMSKPSDVILEINSAKGSLWFEDFTESIQRGSRDGYYLEHFATRNKAERMEKWLRDYYISTQIDKKNGE